MNHLEKSIVSNSYDLYNFIYILNTQYANDPSQLDIKVQSLIVCRLFIKCNYLQWNNKEKLSESHNKIDWHYEKNKKKPKTNKQKKKQVSSADPVSFLIICLVLEKSL